MSITEQKKKKRTPITKALKDAAREWAKNKSCGRVAILNPFTLEVLVVLHEDGEYKPTAYSETEWNLSTEEFYWIRGVGSMHKGSGRSWYFQVDEVEYRASECPPRHSADGTLWKTDFR